MQTFCLCLLSRCAGRLDGRPGRPAERDRATGIRNDKREFGQIIVVRCIGGTDARTATVTPLSWDKLNRIAERITGIKGVNRCLYDLTPKPTAAIEYV